MILKKTYEMVQMICKIASQEAVLRSRTLFQNIYKELNKESKNFSPGLIEKRSKTRDFATSIQWLTMAHVINQSFGLKEHIALPLMPDSESTFRLFLGDIGMFSYQSGINAASFISSERENTLSGIFFENFVANELIAKGHKLFYSFRFTLCHLSQKTLQPLMETLFLEDFNISKYTFNPHTP